MNMAQRPLWWLTVREKTLVYPFLWKLSLAGDSLAAFPRGREGDYIKLLLPKDPGQDLHAVDAHNPDLNAFFKRSYTVCEVDEISSALTLYLTRHEANPGPAARFVDAVQVGQEVLLTGPGPVDQIDVSAEHFLLLGDLPSLGAVLANLRRLPASAVGDLIFEAPVPLSLIDDACPKGVTVHYLTGTLPSSETHFPLMDKLQQLKVPKLRLGVWAACEYSTMKLLKHYFLDELKLEKSAFYLTSYFKQGATDEQHKQTRRDEGYRD